MITPEQAYSVLGVSASTPQADIKLAFRRKAKLLHPDINKSPDAHAQFLNLHEAYALLSGKIKITDTSGVKQDQKVQDQKEERADRARKAAANYARMKYEEYLREVEMYHSSPHAWFFRILYYGLFFIYMLCGMIFAAIPLFLISYGIQWFLISCPLLVLSVFTFSYAYGWKKEIDPLFK